MESTEKIKRKYETCRFCNSETVDTWHDGRKICMKCFGAQDMSGKMPDEARLLRAAYWALIRKVEK